MTVVNGATTTGCYAVLMVRLLQLQNPKIHTYSFLSNTVVSDVSVVVTISAALSGSRGGGGGEVPRAHAVSLHDNGWVM